MDCGPRLTSADISAWCALHDIRLRGWEIRALREMDNARDEWRQKPESEKKMMPATAENLLAALRSKASGDPKKQIRKK